MACRPISADPVAREKGKPGTGEVGEARWCALAVLAECHISDVFVGPYRQPLSFGEDLGDARFNEGSNMDKPRNLVNQSHFPPCKADHPGGIPTTATWFLFEEAEARHGILG